MVRILEPTLFQVSPIVTPNGGFDIGEMDFDFGNLEGALLLQVSYRVFPLTDTTKNWAHALTFNGSAVVPASEAAFQSDRLVFGELFGEEMAIGAAGNTGLHGYTVDLRPLDLVIARNPAYIGYMSAGTAGGTAVVAYKRAQFTETEVGGVVAFRR